MLNTLQSNVGSLLPNIHLPFQELKVSEALYKVSFIAGDFLAGKRLKHHHRCVGYLAEQRWHFNAKRTLISSGTPSLRFFIKYLSMQLTFLQDRD